MKKLFIVIVLILVAVLGYRYLQPKAVVTHSMTTTDAAVDTAVEAPVDFDDIAPTYVDLSPSLEPAKSVPQVVSSSSFSCDGRQHCSQMTSCAEATYFNTYCPNTKMDGNNDGIPCEKQWCK